MNKTPTTNPTTLPAVLRRTAVRAVALTTLVVVSLGAAAATTVVKSEIIVVEPRIVAPVISELSPVAARELLHEPAVALQPESAERARTEETLPSASPAAGQVTRTLAVPYRPYRIVEMEVTAYCPCTRCCGPNAQGITASGKPVSYNGGLFVAADPALKFGTKLIIPGYAADVPVEVIDRGGAIKGNKLDVYFPTHQEARQWGRQKKVRVRVLE